MGRYQRIKPFGEVAKEEVLAGEIQHTKKKAITKQAPMEETDVETNQPMSAEDVKELWRDWRERRKVKKESRMRQ